jgi:taurine dioxygenase
MPSGFSTNQSNALRFSAMNQSGFGVRLEFDTGDIESILKIWLGNAELILSKYYAVGGLMLVKGLSEIRDNPRALVELSKLFGDEVENYRQTLTSERFFHDTVDEIIILGNEPPCNHPPPPKPVNHGNELPTQYPAQINWHTDQSYRRPPPDITLLLAMTLPPRGQGQTLFSDCTAAFKALSPQKQALIKPLRGIHSPSWIGRSREAVETGVKPVDLLPHQLPQQHPLVRKHPVTGEWSLYICEEKQMDYVDGPVVGMSTGPEGEGAALIRDLLVHTTQDEFLHVHEWEVGDMVIGDNRNLLHCATWYDAEQFNRLMWRTTVIGNPGDEYAGEGKAWIPQDGSEVMSGMEDA